MSQLQSMFCRTRRIIAFSLAVFFGGNLLFSTLTTQVAAQPALSNPPSVGEKAGNGRGWIGLSPFLWEISDSKSYTKVYAGFDRGFYLKNRPSLMLGYTLAGAV
jgi:hypothetical protein